VECTQTAIRASNGIKDAKRTGRGGDNMRGKRDRRPHTGLDLELRRAFGAVDFVGAGDFFVAAGFDFFLLLECSPGDEPYRQHGTSVTAG